MWRQVLRLCVLSATLAAASALRLSLLLLGFFLLRLLLHHLEGAAVSPCACRTLEQCASFQATSVMTLSSDLEEQRRSDHVSWSGRILLGKTRGSRHPFLAIFVRVCGNQSTFLDFVNAPTEFRQRGQGLICLPFSSLFDEVLLVESVQSFDRQCTSESCQHRSKKPWWEEEQIMQTCIHQCTLTLASIFSQPSSE